MRKVYDNQLSIDTIPMENIKLDPRGRQAAEGFLYGIREIFLDDQTRVKLMALLESYQPGNRKKVGAVRQANW